MVRAKQVDQFAEQQTRIRDGDKFLKVIAEKAVDTRELMTEVFKVTRPTCLTCTSRNPQQIPSAFCFPGLQIFRRKAMIGNNQISLKGFKAALKGYGINFTAAAAAALFNRMDANRTGSINYQDFVKHLTSLRSSDLSNMDRFVLVFHDSLKTHQQTICQFDFDLSRAY